MKMISKWGFIGMSLLIWIEVFVTEVLGQKNVSDFMFIPNRTRRAETGDVLCKDLENPNWEKIKCKKIIKNSAPEISKELKKCIAKCYTGYYKLCCNGESNVCDDCQLLYGIHFCGKARDQVENGTTPEYCNNFQRPRACGKDYPSDEDLCNNTSPQLKSYFLLMIATIAIITYHLV